MPELAALDNKAIHAPWLAKRLPEDFRLGATTLKPIVDHATQRQRALALFAGISAAKNAAQRVWPDARPQTVQGVRQGRATTRHSFVRGAYLASPRHAPARQHLTTSSPTPGGRGGRRGVAKAQRWRRLGDATQFNKGLPRLVMRMARRFVRSSTGDTQASLPSSSAHQASRGFLRKHLRQFGAQRRPVGAIPLRLKRRVVDAQRLEQRGEENCGSIAPTANHLPSAQQYVP